MKGENLANTDCLSGLHLKVIKEVFFFSTKPEFPFAAEQFLAQN